MGNFFRMAARKPFSLGAIIFLWMPLIGGALILIALGLRYWYITLAAFLLICMAAGTQADERETKASAARMVFENESLRRRDERLRILEQIGKPTCNGDYSPEAKALWQMYREMEAADQAWWNQAVQEVIRLGGY